MRKFVISLGVFGVFLVYSFGIRHQVPVLSKPSSLASNSASSSSTPASNSSTNNSSTNSSSSTNNNSSGSSSTSNSNQYKDGTYQGSVENAYYGNVQVSAVISGGKITNVKILQYPNSHSTSVAINQQAMPYLQQETIQSQSSNIQLISGATFSSQAFIQSLSNALSQA
jgi:uncharacterized protein with FMN-binding domain